MLNGRKKGSHLTEKSEIQVVHNEAERRFEVSLDGKLAHANYVSGSGGKVLVFTHTEVPEEFGGQGIGSKIARFALDYVRENHLRVQPLCPFIRAYIERHSDYKDLTTPY